jgi:4-hydroxy-tetrahydrodipicolinate synthase
MSKPQEVSAADEQLILDLIRLMTVLPGMPFVSAYKVGLAEQSGDDVWLNVRAPLTRLEPHEEKAVREVYRATGQSFDRI